MKLSELALKESKGVWAFLASLFFVRVIKSVSPYHKSSYIVLGVPPWRKLKTRDVYVKPTMEL